MKKVFVIATIILISAGLRAQVADNFSDGDFTSNPVWTGDAAEWTVTNEQLNSNGPDVTGTILQLATPSTLAVNTVWEFWANLKFGTSSGNFMDFYLVSDSANLKGDNSGYFVRIGGTPDEVSLFRKDQGSSQKIIDGVDGRIASTSNNLVKVRVTRDSNNEWQLQSDITGTGSSYQSEGQVTDATYNSSLWLGIYIRYSKANRDQFFFDDISAQVLVPDVTPPVLQSAQAISDDTLVVRFDEVLDQTSAENEANYSVNNGVGQPAQATLDAQDRSLVQLVFSNTFANGVSHQLTVLNAEDPSGNVAGTQTAPFLFYQPQPRDILINELFPDPTPSQGLPGSEFVELYNRSNQPINLDGWAISDGVSTATFSTIVLRPDSFLIITPNAVVSDYQVFGPTLGVSSFPSLNNSGDAITLTDNNGQVIDVVAYDLSWYQDVVKQSGGWTLELINPFDPCGGSNNWRASDAPSGGTPGQQNSIFDDTPDNTAPSLVLATPLDANTVRLVFDESLDSLSLVIGSYQFDNGLTVLGQPQLAPTLDTVVLSTTAIQIGQLYTVTVTNVADCWGNSIGSNNTGSFTYVPPVPAGTFDVVISEIFADPEPVVGLPQAEYIELYNTTSNPIELTGWTFSDGSSQSSAFSTFILDPDSFLIICPEVAVPLYQPFGQVLGLSTFPSLNNTGEPLTLRNADGQLIFTVTYQTDWYRDAVKADGGWSLEMVDPNNPCGGMNNWAASEDPLGGTPGQVNSTNGVNPDQVAPGLLSVFPTSNQELVVAFDEAVDSTTALDPLEYVVDQSIGPASNVVIDNTERTQVRVSFANTFQNSTSYMLTVSGVTDCSGNVINDRNTGSFGLPDAADSGDVVINEVLFNPNSGGVDFVELYNRSDKIIDLGTLRIANLDDLGQLDNVAVIEPRGFLLFPREYIVITEDPDLIKQEYFTSNPDGFIAIDDLPTYNDDEGTVVLADGFGNIFDQFSYTDDLHYGLLDDDDGVSLERIDFNRPTSDATNWQSASSNVGFATPAYRNSQFNNLKGTEAPVSVAPEVFSPDGDGFNDVVNITYRFGTGGTGNITIYDAKGRLVRRLVRNELLGAEGVYSWDGFNEQNEKVPIGIYIIYFELIRLNGDVEQEKLTCVVGARF